MNEKSEKPSAYTRIFWLIQDKKIESDILFNFLELSWPSFIKRDKYIFLKENFSEKKYNELLNEKANPEFWMNLLTVDDFFSENDDWEGKSRSFAKILIEIWQTKLQKEFPSMNFTVEYLHDKEVGDYGLTFYQK